MSTYANTDMALEQHRKGGPKLYNIERVKRNLRESNKINQQIGNKEMSDLPLRSKT